MNDFPRQKLAEILAQYTTTIIGDAHRLEGLLSYVTDNGFPLEVNLLMSALKEGVADELLAAPKAVPPARLLPGIVGRLRDHAGLTQEAAEWAVEAWAEALGHANLPATDPNLFEPPKLDIEARATTLWWTIKQVPVMLFRQTRLSWRLLFDPRVPIWLKLIPIVASAYIISPLGLIVDLIPLAGLLANFAVYMLTLALFNYLAPATVVKEHMARIEQNDAVRRSKITLDTKPVKADKHSQPPR
jgi:uncharacterized membrane protein YkvA (DUF1232 family)